MEAFQLLSAGGVKFNKTKYENDVRLFSNVKSVNTSLSSIEISSHEMPAELDFFKYAHADNGKRKRRTNEPELSQDKRQRIYEDSSEEEEEEKFRTMGRVLTKHKVTSKGNSVPTAVETFEDLRSIHQIPSQLFQNLSKNGYSYPTRIQSHAVPILLAARDLAAISPTGTGKTLSYLIPMMAKMQAPISSLKSEVGLGVRGLVIVPTRELAHQIHNECLKLVQGRKWRIVLFSKATASTLVDKNTRNKVDIIISTPLRLVASLQGGTLDLQNVRHIILDEADRLLDAEFLSQVQEIVAACTHPHLQKAVFSATLPAGAEKTAMEMLRDPIRIVVGLKDTPLPLIQQNLTYVADDQSKLPSLLTYFANPYNPPVLIFTSTQSRASSLAEELTLNGISNVDCLHAGMTKKEREDALSRMRQGQSWILVSTEVMARGMDFKGVREVINYDFPTSVQSYVHRIGRTGRAGREGKAVTFFTDEDAPFLKSIANVVLQSGQTVPDWITKLPKPSKMKRKTMGKVKRPETVNNARKVGRQDVIKKRDMIAGSKRRKAKAAAHVGEEKGDKREPPPSTDTDDIS